MERRSALGVPSSSPFCPHFGRAPQSLVGRDELLADLGGGLATGPGDARYTSVLMGVRGSGKTVLVAVAAKGGTTSPAEVARGAGISSGHAQEALGRLRDTGYLDRPRTGTHRLTDLVPAAVVLDEGKVQDADERSLAPTACRAWMPRASAYCALDAGHSGGHRSRQGRKP